MNRRKKLNNILKKKAKKANAKLGPGNSKSRYVSKAEREKLAQQSDLQEGQPEGDSE